MKPRVGILLVWTVFCTAGAVGGGVPRVECDSCPTPLPDNATASSTITVEGGLCVKVEDVDVAIDIAHTYNADLALTLKAPDGKQVELWSGVGNRGNDFHVAIDDEASRPIREGACSADDPQAGCSGAFQPEGFPEQKLAIFREIDAAGTWTLEVTDSELQDDGTLLGWSLRLTCAEDEPEEPPSCEIATVPAATLLVPYFAVDLDDANGQTTFFSISNAADAAHLAHVTLWTDWAVPSFTFDVYLTGFDVQTVNLRDVLAKGRLPTTGLAVSNLGPRSESHAQFRNCSSSAVPGVPPVYDDPAISETTRSHLQAWHTGKSSPLTNNCAGSDRGNNLAVGYVTIDATRECTPLSPADGGYFGEDGIAIDDNVLFGDVFYVDPAANSAIAQSAVHIRAAPEAFSEGSYTFYGRYVAAAASDNRQGLGNRFAARHVGGGGFDGGSKLIVWRDTKEPAAGAANCGGLPSWGPLETGSLLAFDEQENVAEISDGPFPWATQLVAVDDLALPTPNGILHLDLNHDHGDLFPGLAQGWVSVSMSALGKYNVGFETVELGDVCQGTQ